MGKKKEASDGHAAAAIKRVVALADLHCGHRAGITPPDWWYSTHGGARRAQWGRVQQELWRHYVHMAQEYAEPDLLIVNGDIIDGQARGSAGTELITSDLHEQAEMAIEALSIWKAKKIILTYGTDYHVTLDGQDMEVFIADALDADIDDHAFIKVNGVVFDVQHYNTGGRLPHTRPNSLGAAWLWNILHAERETQPRADIYLRAHLHFFAYIGDGGRLALQQPALQAVSKYGLRRMNSTADWGIVVFEIAGPGQFSWWPVLVGLEAQKFRVVCV